MTNHAHWYVEQYPSQPQPAFDVYDHALSHVPQRLDIGHATIICEHPERFHASFVKRWHKIIRILDRIYASTLDRKVRREIQYKLYILRTTKFILKEPYQTSEPTVWLRPADDLVIPAGTKTLYVAAPLSNEALRVCLMQLPHGATMLVYNDGDPILLVPPGQPVKEAPEVLEETTGDPGDNDTEKSQEEGQK